MFRVKEASNKIKAKGARRAMIICNKEMLRLGYTHDLINAFCAQQIDYVLYSEASDEEQALKVSQCMSFARSHRIDSIVAIGDASVIAFASEVEKGKIARVPVQLIQLDLVG